MNTTAPKNTTAIRQPRTVGWVMPAREASDGDGVRLLRSIGIPSLREVDPFLLLDEFRSDDPGEALPGFPDHPHRGFETITYVLAGRVRHADNKGHQGVVEAGGVQWMTAGRGIIHSEMLETVDGHIWGFQLWLNLPARDKLIAPRYQEFAAEAIPSVALPGGAMLRLVAGRLGEVAGPVQGIATDPLYLDIYLPAECAVLLPVPEGHTAFAYVYAGAVEVGVTPEAAGECRGPGELALLNDGDGVGLRTGSTEGRLLLVAARPLGEPIVRHGPFVMNSQLEIWDAVQDYHTGKF